MASWSRLVWLAALAGGAWAATRGRPQPYDVESHLDGGTLRPISEGRLYHRAVGAGPDLVMLPGFGGNVSTWEFITPPLAETHRVHWVDLLGHGLSDKPAAADYGAPAQAERLDELLRAEGLERVVIVGSSAAGQPAVALAARHPDRVAGLVLVDPFLVAGPGVRLGIWLSRQLPGTSGIILRTLSRQRWYVRLSNMIGRRHPLSVDRATVDRQYLPYGSPGFLDALPALLAGVDPAPAQASIGQVQCPVLLIWGAADRLAGRGQALALAASFQDAEPVILEDAGHVPQEEVPEQVVACMRPFLERVHRASLSQDGQGVAPPG